MKPLLDSALAAPCAQLDRVDVNDFDSLIEKFIGFAKLYGECAARHAETVKAWPK